MENFYEQLPSFSRFGEFTLDHNFVEAPENWSVIITDIRGSTRAIAEGRYKDVNTIGAASIVVARKAMGANEFPFVFGGDGTTMLIPDSNLQAVRESLCALKRLSRNNHQLDLRVGIVGVKKLLNDGKTIHVGKYEIISGMSIAILRGDGLAYAEELIKGSNGYEVDEDVACETDLSGLSCRWNPIPSKKGKILTILVSSRKGQSAYLDFITALSKILPDGIEGSNPVNVDFATYKSISQLLKEERKLHASVFSLKFIARALEIVWLVLVFAHKFPALFFDAAQYANSMRTHSDFRKFDGILRMVLDCGLEQIVQIEAYLKKSMKTASFSLEPPGPTAH